MHLSVIIITLNEVDHIGACLDSVAFADERIVVDGGSTDGTQDIVRQRGATLVVQPDWPGFGPQKNRALNLAQGDWVLSIDADERVPPELQAEILAAVQGERHAAYAMPRLSSYCGTVMRHSGWYPDYVLRLFPRQAARFSEDRVHERVLTELPVLRLRRALQHESYRSLEQVLDKVNRYSTASALDQHARGRRAGLSTAIGHGVWAFFRTYVLRRGFLDGRMGFVLAVSNAENSYYRYLKLWLKQQGR